MSLADGGGGDDQLFTDLLNGHGLGSGDAFTGLPDITGGGGLWDGGGGGGGDLSGAGFLGEDGPGAAAKRETARASKRAPAPTRRGTRPGPPPDARVMRRRTEARVPRVPRDRSRYRSKITRRSSASGR